MDYTYSCMQDNNLYFSAIDHFAHSKRMLDSVFEGGVIHSGENLSNHSAIYLKLDSGHLNLQLEQPQPVKKTCWINATEEAKELFKYTLASKIKDLPRYECISCHDLTCQKVIHHSGIENYTLDLLDAMESSGHECLPIIETSGDSKNSRILGWSQHVKPYADDSKFWYQLWLSAGKPLQGELFINMKISRRQFKYAVRRLKRCEDKLKNEKFLNSLLEKDGNFFKELKKFRGKSCNISSCVDGQVGASNIANKFASNYRDLYNKVDFEGAKSAAS